VTPPLDTGSGVAVYRRLLGYAWPYRWIFLAATLAMAVTSATEVGFAALMKPLIDSGFIDRDPKSIHLIPLAMIGIVVARGVSGFLSNFSMNYIGRMVIFHLRNDMFRRLVHLPSRFYDDHSSGSLISKVIYDVEQVMSATTKAVSSAIKDSLSLVALLSWLFYLSWKLTLVLLLTAPALAISIRLISRRFRKSSRMIQQSMGEITHVVQEAIEGQRVVKTFCAQDAESRFFHEVNEKNQRQALKKARVSALNVPVVELLATVGVAIAVMIAMQEAVAGRMGAGDFVSAITAMMLMMPAIKRLSQVNEVVQTGIAAAGSVFAVMDEAAEPDPGRRELAAVRGRVEYRSVGFRYPSATGPVLDGISFTIEPGQTVALVGASGSGKTTAANLLPRFYMVDHGEILLDGVNINELRLNNLRGHIALVSQETVLFDDSIRNNIAYGSQGEIDDARIESAARAAHVLDFAKQQPEGLDTVVGERGVRLSGGQRQRIAIARALYKNAPILILDEATSALDAESERFVQEAMQKLMENRTTLVIAHRLSTIENASRIVVLERGRVAESGTHGELLARDGSYARLYRIQFSEPAALPAGHGRKSPRPTA
jgi:ATP-binding cassette, subfamily B, bacterial MsbA